MEMIFLNQVKAIAISEEDFDRIYEICLSKTMKSMMTLN